MKAWSALFATLSLCPVLGFASPDLSGYDLVFSDEFNNLTLDSNKWGTTPLWGPFEVINQERQYYVDKLGADSSHEYNPFLLNGSTLKIQAVPTTAALSAPSQPGINDSYWTDNPEFHHNNSYDPSSREYLSGILSTVNKFNFTHGYTEARIKLPEGQGLWSAFWLLTNKYVEDAPEIDIMEALGHKTDTVHHTMHYFDTDNNWALNSSPTYETQGSTFTTDFHVFGLAWSPKKITWYVDGVAVRELTDQDIKIPKQSMYILLNVATGGVWPGDPDGTTPFPASMEVDYVRAYQKKKVSNITPAILNSEYQLMFSDEFNGDSLNRSKWNTNYLWGPYFPINNEHQIYVDKHGRHAESSINPFTVSNGQLTIEAKPLAVADILVQPGINHPDWQTYASHQYNAGYGTANGWTPSYSSGLITSYDAFKFVNGYVEARIQMPDAGGAWPAFWLLNGYYVGPQPEIDIIELDGALPNVGHHSYHYYDTTGNIQSSAVQSASSTGSFTDQYHVYGVQWDSEQIKWYVNGEVVRTLQGAQVSSQLMYVLLNFAVGGDFVGNVVPGDYPAQMKVDYVRAYQRKNHEEAQNTLPQIQSPVGGSKLPGSTVTFNWNSVPNATKYSLWLGDQAGGDEYGRYWTTNTSKTKSGLPTDGSSVYATLKWKTSHWNSTSAELYVAATTEATEEQPQIQSPVGGSILPGSTVTFNWNSVPNATKYSLWLGDQAGGDKYGKYWTTNTSKTISGLPTDGSSVYATLKWKTSRWNSASAELYVAAATEATEEEPQIQSPVGGSILPGSTVTFNWNSVPNATKYSLWLGDQAGGDKYGRYWTTNTKKTISGLPTDGSSVYATLKWLDGKWQSTASTNYTSGD